MMNRDLREERIRIFEDTKYLYGTNRKLTDSILYSRKQQRVIPAGADIPTLPHRGNMPAKVLVSKRRILEAARQYRNRKVCVLNLCGSKPPQNVRWSGYTSRGTTKAA